MDVKINKFSDKRGQVTIFIIVAIIIIVAIVAALYFMGKFTTTSGIKLNPLQDIDKCVRESVQLSIQKVLSGGGKISPEFFKLYQSEKYNYLCYQENYYLTCVNSYPNLKSFVESEIKRDIGSKIRQCFENVKQDYTNKGYDVSMGAFSDSDYNVELLPGSVDVLINRRVDIKKGTSVEISQTSEKFDLRVMSPIYDIVGVIREIVNQESQYCNFDYNGFMVLYPDFEITRMEYDFSRIYVVRDRKSGDEFKFAIRSCALPAGI